MDLDTQVKLAVYRHFAETGRRPSPGEVAERAGSDVAAVLDAYPRLRAQRVLALGMTDQDLRLLARPRLIRLASATGLSDIVPISALARVLAMLEQFAGIGYLAVVVSRPVGMTLALQERGKSA